MAALKKWDGEGLLLSNILMEGFEPEDFSYYCAEDVFKWETPIKDEKQWEELLEVFLGRKQESVEEGKEADHSRILYLYLDPAANSSRTYNILEVLKKKASEHPETEFTLSFFPRSFSEWCVFSDEDRERALQAYLDWVNALSPMENVSVYYPGAEYWLIANPAAYDEGKLTWEIGQKVCTDTLMAHRYEMTEKNAEGYLQILRDQILAERSAPVVYPDLRGWDIAMIGDSILGNYTDATSIPGVVKGLGGARTYNLGINGLTTYNAEQPDHSFQGVVRRILEGDVPAEDTFFADQLKRFLEEDHTNRRMCFVINFGINDYMTGLDPEPDGTGTSYTECLKQGIENMKTAFPEAQVVLMAPNYIHTMDGRTAPRNSAESTLEDYAKAVMDLAAEQGWIGLDNYHELGINAETQGIYLVDQVHMNERGAFPGGTADRVCPGSSIPAEAVNIPEKLKV